MSAATAKQYTPEDRARWRRRDHANIEALQNLVVAEISRLAEEKYIRENPDDENPPTFEMPANVRSLLSALQGAHGGGKVPFEEFERDYLGIGAQLQFRGSREAIRARVRSWVQALDEWQFSVGFQLFVIVPGGDFAYAPDGKQLLHEDGSPVRSKTRFVDYIKPRVDDGVQRARKSATWEKHPGRALEAEAGEVVKELPTLGTRAEAGKEKKSSGPLSVDVYESRQEERIKSTVEKIAHEIELKGGDSGLWVRRLAKMIYGMGDSLTKTENARHDLIALNRLERAEGGAADGSTYNCKSEAGENAGYGEAAGEAENEPLCKKKRSCLTIYAGKHSRD